MFETSTLSASSPVVSETTKASPKSQKIEPMIPRHSAEIMGMEAAWQMAFSLSEVLSGWSVTTTTENLVTTSADSSPSSARTET